MPPRRDLVTRGRVGALVVVLLLVAVGYTAWLAYRTEQDLKDAQSAVTDLRAALEDGDTAARDEAIDRLTTAAASARGHTDGPWWGLTTHLPVVGDDASGVEALSASVDVVATGAVRPLADSVDSLDGLVEDGGVDVATVRDLQGPVTAAHVALDQARGLVDAHDSSGYVGALKTRYVDYVDTIGSLDAALASADKAVQVVPAMIGGEGPRDYLVVFQNNAEIRATGGVPGSWALIHADHGRLTLSKQGSDGDFAVSPQPVTALSPQERSVYGSEIGRYFQDPGFTKDFPRAATIFRAFWDRKFPGTPIDGVVSLDPVGFSYLLRGIGPVTVGGVTLDADNAVQELLNQVYIDEPDPRAQDVFFQQAAKAVFDAATSRIASPVDFAEGFGQAAREGRFLVAPFDDSDAEALAGTRVLGALSGDDGATPHLDVGLNDATGAKMSYYLRYTAQVQSMTCDDDRQTLAASVDLSQTISPAEAKTLPDYITGGGDFGTRAGDQLVIMRIYGPYGGSMSAFKLDGKALNATKAVVLDGRPVDTLAMLIDTSGSSVLTWTATTGAGQTGDTSLGMTPSVVPGDKTYTFPSSC